MKNCCDFCFQLFLPVVLFLFLSVGNVQAQSQPKCDLSKCSPEERAACAKRCESAATSSVASLVDFLFETPALSKSNCQPAACQPSKATAKLVTTETVNAPVYGSNVVAQAEEKPEAKKQNCCKISCLKAKASL